MARGWPLLTCSLLILLGPIFFISSLPSSCRALPATQRTLALLKPDAVGGNHTDAIKSFIEVAGFRIVKEKLLQLDLMTAKVFYFEHSGKPFFDDLINFMTSGPIVAMVLEQENAVALWRNLIGPTDPERARIEQPSSIRAMYGSSTTKNCVHGSDSIAAANREILILLGDVQAEDEAEIRHEEL